MTDAFARSARRSLRRDGRDVTLINPTQSTRDPDHGDVYWQSTNETTTSADLVWRGSPSFERRVEGVGGAVDMVAWLPDTLTAEVTDGSSDDTTAATRIQVEGVNYVVRDVFPEDNGLLRCHGVREEGEPWRA